MISIHRQSDGSYASENGEIIIRKVVSQRNSGRRTEKETLWVTTVFGFELPMGEETLRDAKAETVRFIKHSVEHYTKAISA